jgi:hypothetical protein
MIVNALAGRAAMLLRIGRRFQPLPPPFMKHRAALRTNRGFLKLTFGLVSIVYLLLENTFMASDWMKAGGCAFCTHDNSPLMQRIYSDFDVAAISPSPDGSYRITATLPITSCAL